MIYTEILEQLGNEGRLRRIPPDRSGAALTDLCSNDYMGLARRAGEWMDEFHGRFPRVAMTSSASRLLARDQEVSLQFEAFLERLYGRPALLFNSGWHANTGLIAALSTRGTLWLTDRLIHASAIDGLRMASAEFRRFPHNDMVALRAAVEKYHADFDRIIIMVESVYSMDGDMADLKALASIKNEFNGVMLYVDEAHAVGAIGPEGAGLAAATGTVNDIDVLVGTLGKACASAGAFAVTDATLKSYLINTARSFIFSTALPPVNNAWSLFMMEKLRMMDSARERLAALSRRFRDGIEEITGRPCPSRSAIVPMITGDSFKAVAISRALEDAGILALPIRRPTVPPGGERIRFSLNATLPDTEIDHILGVLSDIWARQSS